MIKDLGNMQEKIGVDSTPIKYVIYIRSFTVQLIGEPFDVMVLGLQVEYVFYTLTDMHIS